MNSMQQALSNIKIPNKSEEVAAKPVLAPAPVQALVPAPAPALAPASAPAPALAPATVAVMGEESHPELWLATREMGFTHMLSIPTADAITVVVGEYENYLQIDHDYYMSNKQTMSRLVKALKVSALTRNLRFNTVKAQNGFSMMIVSRPPPAY